MGGVPAGPGAGRYRDGVMDESRAPGPIPWRLVVLLSLLGTVLATAFVLYDVNVNRDRDGWLIHVGPDHPSRALIERDFPDEPVSVRGSHDGAQFYAVALDPWDPEAAAQWLDRPRYRLQRPLFPLVAWTLHPVGGGSGLVWTLFAVGVAGLFAGAVATGALSTTLRGPPVLAVVFPLLPGAFLALRITVADSLALALALWAVVLSLRGRTGWAVLAGVAAVLTKEPVFITLVGVAIWRRDRGGALLAGVPMLVAGAWAVILRILVPEGTGSFTDIVRPFSGLADSMSHWAEGGSPLALLTFVAAAGLVVATLVRRRPRHPLWWAVVLNAGFLLILGADSMALERNGPRTVLPTLVLALVALLAPGVGEGTPAVTDARPSAAPT